MSAVLLPRSVPRRAFDLAQSLGKLLISTDVVSELDEVLRRPKFDRYVTTERRVEFLVGLMHEAEIVAITETILECRDPRDNKFLELAVSGGATHLLSGDADLLTLNPFRGVAVLTPQEFLEAMESLDP